MVTWKKDETKKNIIMDRIVLSLIVGQQTLEKLVRACSIESREFSLRDIKGGLKELKKQGQIEYNKTSKRYKKNHKHYEFHWVYS